jgi:hypothetical protein
VANDQLPVANEKIEDLADSLLFVNHWPLVTGNWPLISVG